MHILALDTTTRAGSVAVARDGTVLHTVSGDPERTHGERLPSEIARALEAARLRIEQIDLLAVASGPGSFTGLRVGIAAVQGLALARERKVVPVPTLDALACAGAAHADGTAVAAWMDGHRGEVFAALYEVQPTRHEIEGPIARDPAAVLASWRLEHLPRVVFIGDGAVRYRELIVSRLGARAVVVDPPPLAPSVARIAFDHAQRAVAPHEIVPVYVRRPDAELARERRASASPQEPPR